MTITEQFRKKIIAFKEKLSEENYELTFEDKVFMRYIVTTFLETIELERDLSAEVMMITEQFWKKIVDFQKRLSEEDYELTFEDKVFMRYLVATFSEYCRHIDDLNDHEECSGCIFPYDHVKCKLTARHTKDSNRHE